MLAWRLPLGVAILSALAGLCYLDYHATLAGIWLLPVAVGMGGLAAGEMAALRPAGQSPVNGWIASVCVPLIVALGGMPVFLARPAQGCPVALLGWPAVGLAAATLAILVATVFQYRGAAQPSVDPAFSVFALVYVGLLLSFLVQLRLVGNNTQGLVALLSLIATVKLADIGAYTIGRLVGRHKMAPLLSPGKTWEGAAGGLLGAWLGAWLTCVLLARSLGMAPFATTGWLVYGLLVGVAGMIGDLAESYLKRAAGVKDSSHWLPGFGGVLDLLDSLLVAAPVAYVFWCIRASGLVSTLAQWTR